MTKKILSAVLSVLIVLSFTLTGCGSSTQQAASNGKPVEIKFWYMWSGHDAEAIEKIIADFNKKQSKYVVKGLSVPDEKKIITGIASGDGPDVTDSFSGSIASYAAKGTMEPLDNYIKKDNFTKDFVKSSLDACKYKGKQYALPTGAGEGMMMFYNKKLLKDAGFDNPPKTDKELMDVAYKTTKLDSNGNISVLGFPDFPFVYYTADMTYNLGGDYISKDGKTLTPDNPGTIRALQMISEYRKKYGQDKIDKFNSANGAYVSPQDPFITGHQALRFDGTWLIGLLAKYNKDLDYGIAMLPYLDGHPELEGAGSTSASVLYMPSSSKHKDGAWEFLKYIEGPEGMKTFAVENGFIPARKALWKDKDISSLPGFKDFTAKVAKGKMKAFPAFPTQDQYNTELSNAYELAATGKMTPEAAMKQCKDKVKDLLNNN